MEKKNDEYGNWTFSSHFQRSMYYQEVDSTCLVQFFYMVTFCLSHRTCHIFSGVA